MLRFILPIIFIGIGVTGFFLFANPLYQDISALREQTSFYNEALDNSKALENERDKLTQQYNSITGEALDRLQKLLPENVDNIRLILEIEKIARPFGMAIKDVKYDARKKEDSAAPAEGVIQGGETALSLDKDYGILNLEFSTEGTYNNFISFMKALESNLRIVDITTIQFSSGNTVLAGASPALPDVYKYSFKIKTYWLKN